MQENTPQTEQGPKTWGENGAAPGTAAGATNADAPEFRPLGFWKLAMALFIYPRMALLNARVHKLWGKGLALTCLVALAAAVIMAIQTVPLIKEQTRDLNDLVQETLGELTYDAAEDAIGWTGELKTPWTKNRRKWQLDVLQSLGDFDPLKAKEGMQPAGIIVARDGMSAWMRNPQDNSITQLRRLPRESIRDLFTQLGEQQGGKLVIRRESVDQLIPVIAPFAAIAVAVATAAYNLKMIITCVGLFVIMSMLFNRADKATFGAVCASSLACTFPPFTLALGFSLVPGIPADVDMLFTVFFVVYLIVILLDRSIPIRRMPR